MNYNATEHEPEENENERTFDKMRQLEVHGIMG